MCNSLCLNNEEQYLWETVGCSEQDLRLLYKIKKNILVALASFLRVIHRQDRNTYWFKEREETKDVNLTENKSVLKQ